MLRNGPPWKVRWKETRGSHHASGNFVRGRHLSKSCWSFPIWRETIYVPARRRADGRNIDWNTTRYCLLVFCEAVWWRLRRSWRECQKILGFIMAEYLSSNAKRKFGSTRQINYVGCELCWRSAYIKDYRNAVWSFSRVSPCWLVRLSRSKAPFCNFRLLEYCVTKILCQDAFS